MPSCVYVRLLLQNCPDLWRQYRWVKVPPHRSTFFAPPAALLSPLHEFHHGSRRLLDTRHHPRRLDLRHSGQHVQSEDGQEGDVGSVAVLCSHTLFVARIMQL